MTYHTLIEEVARAAYSYFVLHRGEYRHQALEWEQISEDTRSLYRGLAGVLVGSFGPRVFGRPSIVAPTTRWMRLRAWWQGWKERNWIDDDPYQEPSPLDELRRKQ